MSERAIPIRNHRKSRPGAFARHLIAHRFAILTVLAWYQLQNFATGNPLRPNSKTPQDSETRVEDSKSKSSNEGTVDPSSAASSASFPPVPSGSEDGRSQVIMANGKKPSKSAERLKQKSGSTSSSLGNVSLSEVVRATEEAKKKRTGKGVKSFTTKDIAPRVTKETNSRKKTPERGPGPALEATGGYDSIRDTKGRDESWWKDAMAGSRGKIANLEKLIQNLQLDVDGLKNSFYSQDDPAYRDGVIKPKWDSALRALESAKIDLGTARADHQRLEEEARSSGALPGWLR